MSSNFLLNKTDIEQTNKTISTDQITFWNDNLATTDVIEGYNIRPSSHLVIDDVLKSVDKNKACQNDFGEGWYWDSGMVGEGAWMFNVKPTDAYQKEYAKGPPDAWQKRSALSGNYLACRKDYNVPDNKLACCLINTGLVTTSQGLIDAGVPDGTPRTFGDIILAGLDDTTHYRANRILCRPQYRVQAGVSNDYNPIVNSDYERGIFTGTPITYANPGAVCGEIVADWCYKPDPDDSQRRIRMITNAKCREWAANDPFANNAKMLTYCLNNPTDGACKCVNREDKDSADYDTYMKIYNLVSPQTTNAGCWYPPCRDTINNLIPSQFLDPTGCPTIVCQNIIDVLDSSDVNMDNVSQFLNCSVSGGTTPTDSSLADLTPATPIPADNGGSTPADNGGSTPAVDPTPADNGGTTPTPRTNITWLIVLGLIFVFLFVIILMIIIRSRSG